MDEERKHLTILFADLVNSTGRIAERDPEDALALFRPALRAMADAVRRFGGTVNHTMGDGLMAMFGAPRAIGEHALNAVCAGLEMHRQVAAMRLGLELRIGIHSGEVVLHRLDATGQLTLEAAGEPVHLAARLQEAAPPGGTWITADTFALLREVVRAQPVAAAVLRGFRQPVAAYAVEAVDPASLAGTGASLFIDREAELAVLRDAFARARMGGGHAVALVGEPGIGKSRLMREFVAGIGSAARVEHLACAQWRSDTGFHPILGLTRRLLGLEDDEASPLARESIAAALAGLALPAELVPALCALHGVDPGPDWTQLSPARRRAAIVEACRALLFDAAARRPLVVALDDLHWADPETEALIERLLDGLDRAALLLLLGWRPDYAPAWAARAGLTRLAVPPLAPADAQALTQSALGARGGDADLVAAVAARAGGNPFFIEEAAKLADPAAVPPSVRGLLAERIDRLPEAGKRFVEVVAAMGEPVPPALVRVVLGAEDETAEELARALERAGVLHLEGHGAAVRCSCRHSLLAEVAYGGLTRQRRRELHARIVRAQEAAAPEASNDNAALLARHARLGEDWQAALRHARTAGERAGLRSANREALRFYEEALEALAHLPEDAEALRAGIDLRFAMRDPLFRMGRIEPLRQRLAEAAALAERLGDAGRLGRLLIYQSHHAWLAGDNAAAIAAADRASALAEAERDAALSLRAVFQRALGEMGAGEMAAAAAGMAEVAARAEDPALGGRFGLDRELAVVAAGYRARALTDLGDLDEAAAAAADCAARAGALGNAFEAIFSAVADGYLSLRRFQHSAAVARLEQGLAYCAQAEADLMRPVVLAFLGAARVAAGDLARGIEDLATAAEAARAMGFLFQQPLRLVLLANALRLAGRENEAREKVAEAEALAGGGFGWIAAAAAMLMPTSGATTTGC